MSCQSPTTLVLKEEKMLTRQRASPVQVLVECQLNANASTMDSERTEPDWNRERSVKDMGQQALQGGLQTVEETQEPSSDAMTLVLNN